MSNWLAYSPTSGVGNGTITLTAETLSELEDRVATLVAKTTVPSDISATTIVEQRSETPTSITFNSLTWVSDIPATGGTASSANCSYVIYGHYANGRSADISSFATVTGSAYVSGSISETRHSAGTLTLTASYHNTSATSSVTIYQEANILGEYLTFNIISGGSIYWKNNNVYGNTDRTIEYSKDGGQNWTSITSSTGGTAIIVETGDVVLFRGDNQYYNRNAFTSKISSSAKYNVSGNIMSLIDSTGFATATTLNASAFHGIFSGNTALISAEELLLPATTLGDGCYEDMFNGCKNLIKAPVLSASTVSPNGYSGMFAFCTSLITPPKINATTIGASGCSYMFESCTALTSTPDLPATTLAESCYQYMFSGCKSLTTAKKLPATTLENGCYGHMFSGCTSLETAPDLPAPTLATWCYNFMFYNCTSLNRIKCLATDISAANCTTSWIEGIESETGTFVKSSSMNDWPQSYYNLDGIPYGWTVINA